MKSKSMKITATITAVVLASILAIPSIVDIDQFRPQLESRLKSALGREVHLGHMELSLLAGGARVNQITVADDPAFSKNAFLQAKSVAVGVSLWSLIFSRSLHVTSLTIAEPKIAAIQSRSGKWNFAGIGGTQSTEENSEASATSSPSISSVVLDRVVISNATIELGSCPHTSPKATLKNVEVTLRSVSLDSAIAFSLSAAAGDGKLQIEGNAGPFKNAKDDDAKSATVHMKLNGSNVPLDSVEVFLPALGIVLPGGSTLHGGTVTARLSIDGPMDHLTTSGHVEIAKARLKGFDLSSKLSQFGAESSANSSDLAIFNLATQLRVAPDGTHISGFSGQFGGIGSITGDGDVSASHHLQFKMVAHVPSDGAVRFGLNRVGLKNLPNDIPFQVVGTTAMPIVIPDLSGMAKNTAKSMATNAAANAGKAALKRIAANNGPTAPAQAATKKGGFFHNLFHHKEKQSNAATSTQLASQNTKF
jgi:hypothetical protein